MEGLLLPLLLDGQVPLPGQMVSLIIICEFGFDVVAAPGQHTLWGFLHGGQELVLLCSGPIAPNHIVSLVNWKETGVGVEKNEPPQSSC